MLSQFRSDVLSLWFIDHITHTTHHTRAKNKLKKESNWIKNKNNKERNKEIRISYKYFGFYQYDPFNSCLSLVSTRSTNHWSDITFFFV